MRKEKGFIVEAISGFYYVELQNKEIVTCKAKGIFRKKNKKPLVGDKVTVEIESSGEGMVAEIHPRKSEFIRPPIANLDNVMVVVSAVKPTPNYLVIDKMLSTIHVQGAKGYIIITKNDLADCSEIEDIYSKAGIGVFVIDYQDNNGINILKDTLLGKVSAFIGNSGVGKSTLLNKLYKDLNLETGIISDKLGRGKHTTRTVTLYNIPGGGYIADTPGFSSLDLVKTNNISKDQLAHTFLEFEPFLGDCKFTGCSHTVEKGCAVLKALKEGYIHPVRHENYVTLYNELKEIKEWEMK